MEYGHHVNFNNMVAPLAVITQDGERVGGSGFLVQISGQIYLVTVAHLPTGGQIEQTDDWALWANEITLHDANDTLLGRAALFDMHDGSKTPRFKYGRSNDVPGILADVILLPLSAGDPMASMSEIFLLPAQSTARIGETVTAVGCRPWPASNTAAHVITGLDGAVLHVEPPTQPGDSGGPVVTSSGALLAMSYGLDNPSTPGHQGLTLTVGLIQAVAGAVDGFIAGQTYSDAVTQTRTHP